MTRADGEEQLLTPGPAASVTARRFAASPAVSSPSGTGSQCGLSDSYERVDTRAPSCLHSRSRSGSTASSSAAASPARHAHFAPALITSIATYDPFACAAHRGGAGRPAAAVAGSVEVAAAQGTAPVERDGDKGECYVRYVFDVVVEGTVVHTVATRYSALRRRAKGAGRLCPSLPAFPPRRWWRDNTSCHQHVVQRAGELRQWLQAIASPDLSLPRGEQLQLSAAALRVLGLKRRSLAARLIREAGRTRRALAAGACLDDLLAQRDPPEESDDVSDATTEDDGVAAPTPFRRKGTPPPGDWAATLAGRGGSDDAVAADSRRS